MPAPTTAVCTSYKQELLLATHNHAASGGNAFKLALYKAAASVAGTHGASDTNYSAMGSDELGAAGAYATGGVSLTNIAPAISGTSAYTAFSTPVNISFSGTVTNTVTSGCMIYNSSSVGATPTTGRAMMNVSWGADQTITAGGSLAITVPSALLTLS